MVLITNNLGVPSLLSFRKNSGLLVALIALGVIISLINSWPIQIWKAKPIPVNSQVEPIKNTKQPLPQQLNSAYIEDKYKGYSSLSTEVIWQNLFAG
jgi:hypothetical protein